MSLYVIATAAGLAASALGLSIWGLWRGASGHGAIERALREHAEATESRFDALRASVDAQGAQAGIVAGLRGEVATVVEHLGALAAGHVALTKSLEELAAASTDLKSQMVENDKRAIARNEVLRDDQQKLSEQIEAATDHLTSAIEASRRALHDEVAPVLECSAALSSQINDLPNAMGGSASATGAAAPAGYIDAIAQASAAAASEALAQRIDGLRAELLAAVAEAARVAAPQPRVFDASRVVSLANGVPAATPAAPAASRVFPSGRIGESGV